MLDSRAHGVLDYLTAILLFAAPYLLGFANGGPEQWVPQALGALILVVSLMTAYEISVVKLIPYRVHLAVDLIQAVLLIASPWLLSFSQRVWWPHVAVGVIEIIVVLLSWGRVMQHRPQA